MSKNYIADVRPGSTFDNYLPQTDSQKEALEQVRALTNQLIGAAPSFSGNSSPFPNGGLIVLAGGVGIGKTHLIESMINEIGDKAPALLKRCFLQRGNLTTAIVGAGLGSQLNETPVLLIDDAYADKQRISDLSDFELKGFMKLLTDAYEKRALIVVTSNFPFLNDGGLLQAISSVDTVGRVTSRCKELFATGGGELAISGPDYREIIAQQVIHRRKANRPSIVGFIKAEPHKPS